MSASKHEIAVIMLGYFDALEREPRRSDYDGCYHHVVEGLHGQLEDEGLGSQLDAHEEALFDDLWFEEVTDGPDGIKYAPKSLQRAGWKHVRWSGNPPHASVVMGWIVRLRGPATKEEKAWFKSNQFVFSGGKWGKPDE